MLLTALDHFALGCEHHRSRRPEIGVKGLDDRGIDRSLRSEADHIIGTGTACGILVFDKQFQRGQRRKGFCLVAFVANQFSVRSVIFDGSNGGIL